jgi:Asp-tRNA(Asn)/Glu-tRNA(Gln) amidotransferase A subunit family amidase
MTAPAEVAAVPGLTDADVRAFVVEISAPERAGDGSLADVRTAIKDLFRVDGTPTRAGSTLPAEIFAGPESKVVGRLRAAGAIVVGKTAMDEFAYCEPPATRNPRDLKRTPGGSSGGSAAAVAAGLCELGIGSQTLQSTIVPASYCGVIGYKPTAGRTLFDGVALAPTLDTIGLLTRSVDLLGRAAAAVVDDWAPTASHPPRVGVPKPWGYRRLHEEGWEAFNAHVEMLRVVGIEAAKCQVPWSDDLDLWAGLVGDLVHAEMAEVHARWFEGFTELYRLRTAEAVERGRAVSGARLRECHQRRNELTERLDEVARDAAIDCWICPSAGSVAPEGYESTGDSWMTCFWSYAGLPCLSLPVFDGPNGLPHGLQVIGRLNTDEQLVGRAAILLEAIQHVSY